MCESVKHILCNPRLAGYLSQNARDRLTLYDWDVVLPQWEELFQRVARGERN